MSFDREDFEPPYLQAELPHWKCPTCLRGNLYLIPKTLVKKVLTSSQDRGPYDIEDKDQLFYSELKCSNPKCHESINMSGRISSRFEWDDSKNRKYFHDYFYPEYFYPHLKIFAVPDYISCDVEYALDNVFKLFWIDKSACANAVRTTVEEIMTDQRVRKTDPKSKKRNYLKLHARIKLYEKRNPKVAELLLAIKWIGNDGSHTIDLDPDTLLNGLELLQHAIEKLYSDRESRLESLAKEINKRKERK